MQIVNIEQKWIASLQITGIDESYILALIMIRSTLFGGHLFVQCVLVSRVWMKNRGCEELPMIWKCTTNVTMILGPGRRHGSRLSLKTDVINIYCMASQGSGKVMISYAIYS